MKAAAVQWRQLLLQQLTFSTYWLMAGRLAYF
jgi:hypothetical protein